MKFVVWLLFAVATACLFGQAYITPENHRPDVGLATWSLGLVFVAVCLFVFDRAVSHRTGKKSDPD